MIHWVLESFPPLAAKTEEKEASLKFEWELWFFSDWTFEINLLCLRDSINKKKFTIKLNSGLSEFKESQLGFRKALVVGEQTWVVSS